MTRAPFFQYRVKTADHAMVDHLLAKHKAWIERPTGPSSQGIEYRLHCYELPGALIFTEADVIEVDEPYALILSKFVAALDAEGITP